MNWFKLAAKIIPFNVDTMDYVDYGVDDDQYGVAEQAEQAFQESGIRTDRNKNISHVAVENGQVIGALSSGWSLEDDTYVYAFDVAVKPEFRTGLTGLKLIEEGIRFYQQDRASYSEMGHNTMMRLWVVNKRLIPILERRYGLNIESQHNDGSAHMTMY